MRILLTTTSYQDTPGKHHDLLAESGFEVVRARGPLTEAQLLELIRDQGPFDAFLNGDDLITATVIDAAAPQLKAICKYGIGLDSIDVDYATSKKLPVLFTPGVNHTTVAEHAIGLMIAASKHFWPHTQAVKGGDWKRITGNELMGKTVGVLGMGRIGKELLIRRRSVRHVPGRIRRLLGRGLRLRTQRAPVRNPRRPDRRSRRHLPAHAHDRADRRIHQHPKHRPHERRRRGHQHRPRRPGERAGRGRGVSQRETQGVSCSSPRGLCFFTYSFLRVTFRQHFT